MAFPIDEFQHVPFTAMQTPTNEIEPHCRGGIRGNVKAFRIITNWRTIRICIWALCAEIVVVYIG